MKMVLKLSDSVSAIPDPTDDIREQLLSEDMERFFEMLMEALEPQKPYLTKVEYELYRRGKKLRPMLLLLSARMMLGPQAALSKKVIQGAVSLEMLHVATLIHDDIVDHALLRRGLDSVNAARGTEKAVIIGDMQFVQAIRGFVDAIDTQQDMNLVKLVLDTAFRICCGELDELDTDPTWHTKQLVSKYMETIERKTAVLFGLACESGISLAAGRTGETRRGGFYGRRVGRAFQIMDDLLDFSHSGASAGKTRGMDLRHRRLSLPLIYAMEELGGEHIVSRIMRGADYTEGDIDYGIKEVMFTSAYARAYVDARTQALEAAEYLRPFPQNRYRKALEQLSLHVVNRGF